MKRGAIHLISLFCLILAFFLEDAATSIPPKVEDIEIIQYGIFEAVEIRKMEAEGTAVGTIHLVRESRHAKETDNIPGTIGTRFGICYIVRGRPKEEKVVLLVKVLHPATKNPKTQVTRIIDQWKSYKKIGHVHCSGWKFEYDWEIVPGQWIIQLSYEGRKLAEKTFTVYKP